MGFSAPLSKPQRDLRIGYGALGVGAAAFVMLSVTTLYVTDTDIPGLPVAQPPAAPAAQQVADAQVLVRAAAPVAAGSDAGPAAGGVSGGGVAPAAPSGGTPQAGPADGTPGTPPNPPGGGDGPGDPGPGGPGPGGPGPGPGGPGGAGQGPVSALVDPVVAGAVGAVDGLTGGALAPVTGPVQATTDGLTDTLDGLLGAGLLGGGRRP